MGSWIDKAKSGGGSTVEGKITDYEFVPYFPFGDDDEPGDSIYLRADITPDGAEEPTGKSWWVGSGQYLTIEEDGKTLKHTEEDSVPRLYSEGTAYKFLASMGEAGFPLDSRLPDPEEEKVIDLRGLIGTRIRVTEEVDEEATKKLGKRKAKKGKHKGKEFNRTWTKCVKVLALPDEDDDKPAKKASSTKGKASSKKAKDDDEADDAPSAKVADKFLVKLLQAAKNNSLQKSDLPVTITRAAQKESMATSEREALRKLISSDEYLTDAAERGVIAYNPASKKQLISLPEEDDE